MKDTEINNGIEINDKVQNESEYKFSNIFKHKDMIINELDTIATSLIHEYVYNCIYYII